MHLSHGLLADTAFHVCPQSAFTPAIPPFLSNCLPPALTPLRPPPPSGAFLPHAFHTQSSTATTTLPHLSDGERSDLTNILQASCRPATPTLVAPSDVPKLPPGSSSPDGEVGSAARVPPAGPVRWTERLCHTTFFGQCPHHKSNKYRRCENTFFCMDCGHSGGLCSLCVREHADCRTLQIRRYVYRDVVKVADVAAYVDTTGIQSYTVNHAQAIFLSAKDKVPVGPYYRVDSSSRCEACNRGLRPGCTYCSLACKLSATEGMPLPAVAVHNKPPPRSRKALKAAARSACSDTLSDTLSEQHKQASDDSARSNALDAAVSSLALGPAGAAAAVSSGHRTARAAALVSAQRVRQSVAAAPRLSPDAPRKRPRAAALPASSAPCASVAAASLVLAARGRRKQHCPVRASD